MTTTCWVCDYENRRTSGDTFDLLSEYRDEDGVLPRDKTCCRRHRYGSLAPYARNEPLRPIIEITPAEDVSVVRAYLACGHHIELCNYSGSYFARCPRCT